MGSVSIKLRRHGIISKLCRVIMYQVDIDLTVEVEEVGARSLSNSSEVLVLEMSLYSWQENMLALT